jgi:chromosome partitioning protein
MALQGYKVLIIDLDSQGSTTTLCGYYPDADISFDQTALPIFLHPNDEAYSDSLKPSIRKTTWENLDLVPANLALYGAEYEVPSFADEKDGVAILGNALEELKLEYDIIFIDPPPALGVLSLNTIAAATGILIPMPPKILDFVSTLQFFRMLQEVIEMRDENKGNNIEYDFIKILPCRKKSRTDTK